MASLSLLAGWTKVCGTDTVYESHVCKVSQPRLNQKCKQTCTHIYADFIIIDALT